MPSDRDATQRPSGVAAAVRRRALVGASISVGLLAATLLLVTIAQAGRIVPGTHVLGVDVGGQDRWEARRTLVPALERAERRTLAVSAPGVRLGVRPIDAGLRIDVDATVDAALAHGRRGPLGALSRLTTPLIGADIRPRTTVDATAITAWVDSAATIVERTASPGDLVVDASTRTVRVVGPRGGVTVDRATSAARLQEALLSFDLARVILASETTPPPTERARIEQLADQVARALRTGLTLTHDGRTLRIPGADLAALITVDAASDGDTVVPRLRIPVDRVEALLGPAARTTFERSPTPARLDIAEPTVALDARGSTSFRPAPIVATVEPHVDRIVVVPRRIARQIERMVGDGVTRTAADLLVIAPEVTTAVVEEQLPTHVLGTFTTRYAPGGPRTVNIARLAALIDGSLIAPGAEFSVNRASGPRSCTAGFLEAGTIVRGELVDTCGGGVSQLGTTLLNAAFFAGLPLTEWQPHSFYISRYPAGREATLSYPALDVRFRNDTDGWIVLRATTTATSVTVTLLGRPRWEEVRAEHGPWSPPTPFAELVRIAPDLAPGTQRVVQAGGDGFSLTVSRTRIPPGGAPEDVERWRTVYRPQQRIVEVSPVDAPGDAAPPAVDAGGSDG